MDTLTRLVDCRKCIHGQKLSYHQRLCDVLSVPRPIEFMRDYRSECGPDAKLFSPMNKEE